MEKEIEFYIDGEKHGSATLFIENGEVDTTNAEDTFWKVLRFNKKELIDEELSELIDNLTSEQEDKLKEAHGKDYHGTDDDMPDAYEAWLEYASLDEIKEILK